jgi:hypothetical protein
MDNADKVYKYFVETGILFVAPSGKIWRKKKFNHKTQQYEPIKPQRPWEQLWIDGVVGNWL